MKWVSLALCAVLLPLPPCVGADSSHTEESPPEVLAAAAADDDDTALEAAVEAGGDAGAVARLAAARHASALHRIGHSPRVQEPTLALLRSAARLVPASAAYWNDLGVFELRRGMHKKAQQRFQRALRAADPPGHAEARANLARLHAVYWDDGALPKTLLHDHDRVEIEHGLTNLTRVHVDDLTKPSFQHYRLGAVPYILTGAVTRERGYDAAWWSLRRQGELFPTSPTDFYPQVSLQASYSYSCTSASSVFYLLTTTCSTRFAPTSLLVAAGHELRRHPHAAVVHARARRRAAAHDRHL